MPAQNIPAKRSQYNASSISAAANANVSATSTDEITRRFNLLKDEAPELGGKVLWNLASSGQPDAMLVASAVRALDLGQIKAGIETLKGESIERQKVAWENMSTAKQQIYLDNGYTIPKESSPWWKSALGTAFSPVRAVATGLGKAIDVIEEGPIGTGIGAVGKGVAGVFNAMTWVQDQTINRPFRAFVDTSAQNMEARLDLTFEEARQSLEKQGVSLTDADWEYLKWKYVEVNGLSRVQYGYEGDNPQGALVARWMLQSNPGGAAPLAMLDALTEINQVADIARGIPLLGRLVRDPKTENPYDSRSRSSGSGISDAVYEMFNNEVKKLSENENYNLSAWSAWNRASNGATMISPVKQVESINKLRAAGLDNEAFDYALYRAKGRSEDEWLQEVEGITADDPRYEQRRLELAQKWEGQETIKEVIGDLSANASKYSIGRGYAYAAGLDENSALFTAVSGAADAAVVMTLDPTLFLGKANKIWRVVRKGVQVADIGRIRWFAKGLTEAGNVLDTPIIEGAEQIARVNQATSSIDDSFDLLKPVFERADIDEVAPLIDESGKATDFAIDNYDQIKNFIDDAQQSLLTQRSYFAEKNVESLSRTEGQIPRYVKQTEQINEQLDALEITKQVLLRIPPPDGSVRQLGRTLSHARVKQAENYNRWIETVNDAFKKIRSAATDEERFAIGNELRRALPKGNAVVKEMIDYDRRLIENGFAGLDDYDSVWDFIEANQMLWGSGRGTGQAVKGFGNGTRVKDSWRLFSNGAESAVFDRNRYTMLPELTKAGVFKQRFASRSDLALEQIKSLKNVNKELDADLSFATNLAIRIGSKPARMTAALLWNLTHQLPRGGQIFSLNGPDAVAEFEKLLNFGVFAGMKRKDQDIFMGKFLFGLGEENVSRWIYNGTIKDGENAYKAWRDLIYSPEGKKLVNALREFQGTKINPNFDAVEPSALQAIFRETGQLTDYGIANFDELNAIIDDVFANNLDNPGIQIFKKQVEANSRASTGASRFLVQRLFIEDLFQRTGMYDVPNAKETVDRFLNQLLSSRYGPNDLDVIGLGDAAQRVALLPTAQYSDIVAIPDFVKDIQANATKLGLLSRAIRSTFNTDIVETAMSTYWKPLTLMRLGFIPRAAGEEFLAFYARAGIWAPISLAATQTAADRRGLLTGAINLAGRLSNKKFGVLSRAGLDEDIWKLSAMAPHKNVSDYIASVAKLARRTDAPELNRYDHLALHAAYWTGTVARSAKQLQFRMLPEILQSGIAASMTAKNVNWVQKGLLTMDGLADTVQEAANVAMRDAYFQQGIAAAHVDVGRTAAPNPADDSIDNLTNLSVRTSGYAPATETVTVKLSHEFEPIVDTHNSTDTQISYVYSQADQELVLLPVYDELAGALDASTLDTAIAPMFRDTPYAVPVTVVEPKIGLEGFVTDDLGADIDIANPRNLLDRPAPDEDPDLLDRYVEALRVRAEGLSEDVRQTVDEATGEVLLSNKLPEFTVESDVSINDLDVLDREGMRLATRTPEEVVLEEGTALSSRSQYVLDELDIDAMSNKAIDTIVPKLSDEDILRYIIDLDIESEIAEVRGNEFASATFENDYFDTAIRREWAARVETKKFTKQNIEDAINRFDSQPNMFMSAEEYAYQGDRTVSDAGRVELIDTQFETEYTEIVAQLSDKDVLQLQANNIIRGEIAEQQNPDVAVDAVVEIVNREWTRRQTTKKFQPAQVRQYLDELHAEQKIDFEPYDLTEVLVPVSDVSKMPYDIPPAAITRDAIVADLNRIAQGISFPGRSIWFNSEVLGASDEADKLSRLAQVIAERGYVVPQVVSSTSRVTRIVTDDVVEAANRFREQILALPKRDRDLVFRWVQGTEYIPNGSVSIETWEKLGLFDASSVLTPNIKSHLQHSQPDGAFNQLLTRALNNMSGVNPDRALFDILDILTRTDTPRYRQVLTSDKPIRIATKQELIDSAKTIIRAQLDNPAFSKQVRGNRRYLVNSNNAVPMSVPTGDNVHQIFYVMGRGNTNRDIIEGLANLSDDEYQRIIDVIASHGYAPEVTESIEHIIHNFDTKSARALLDAAVLRGGDMLPISSVGFMDYDHAREVGEALEIALGASDFNEVDETLRTVRVGATSTAKDARDIIRLPNATYAHQSVDDGLLWGARPLDPVEIKRFDDGGNLDEFGNTVIEGGTIDENLDAWADKLSRFVADIFFSRRGEVLHEVIQPMRRGTFGVDAITAIPKSDLPAVLYRPKEFIPPKEKLITRAASTGFGRIINPAIFALVRHPMYLLAFSNGYEFARANNLIFRNANLDRFATLWAQNNKVDLNELRNIWAMIPEEKRGGIFEVKQFQEQLTDLAALDRFNPESTWVRFLDEDHVKGLSQSQTSDLKSMIEWIKMDQNVERINVKVAMDRAMDEMIPYIDDHNVRSFFQEYARNIMPFEFAQEQFLKRWARTVMYSPESLRRTQLLAHAFTTNGFIEEQNGQKYLVIPGTESLNSLLASTPVLDTLFGGNIRMPTAIPMGMNTRNILPGVPADLENLPAFSPIAMFGVEQLSNHFPEIKRIAQEFNGGRPIESDDNLIDAFVDFVPQNYQRLYAGLTRGYAPMPKGIDGEFSRNAIAAIQQAAAEAERLRIEQRQLVALGKDEEAAAMQRRINQLDPPPNASAQQVEEWLDSIKDWTRANMFVRGALGFVLPTTATNVFEGKTLANEFGQLLQVMDFDTALATFLAENPDGAAYTVFTSSKSTKAPIPRTEQAINWMRDNQGWMKAYPLAAPWLVPQSKSTDDFSQQAHVDTIGMGIRNMKDVNEWYADFKFAAGANRYFPTKEAFDLAKSQARSSAERGMLEAQWQAESALIKMQHPLFAEKLESMVSTEADQTMEQLRNVLALPDSELPDVEGIDGLREAVSSWDVYVSEYSLLSGKNSKAARTKRENLKVSFIEYGKDLLLRYPEMRTFWNSIVLSSLDLVSKKKILENGEI